MEKSKKMIKTQLKDEDGTDLIYFDISLNCPVSLARIENPSRGKYCLHIQCFDLLTYLNLNKLPKAKWICPICNKYCPFSQLIIDPFYKEILNTTNAETIRIKNDGSWEVLKENDEEDEEDNKREFEVIDLIDDDDDEPYKKKIKI